MRYSKLKALSIGVLMATYVLTFSTIGNSIAKRKMGPDSVTRSGVHISSDQVGVHNGRVFSISGARADLATGTYHWVSFTTPATGSIHLKDIDVWTEQDDGILYFLEDPAAFGTASASAFMAFNRNRQAGNFTTTTIWNGVDVVPSGEGEAITGAATATNVFTMTGATETVVMGDMIAVDGSTGNDGFYTVTATSFSTPTLSITVASITDATTDGDIFPLGALLEKTVFNSSSTTASRVTDNDVEFVLAKGTTYLIGIYNSASSAADIAAWAMWSEEGK